MHIFKIYMSYQYILYYYRMSRILLCIYNFIEWNNFNMYIITCFTIFLTFFQYFNELWSIFVLSIFSYDIFIKFNYQHFVNFLFFSILAKFLFSIHTLHWLAIKNWHKKFFYFYLFIYLFLLHYSLYFTYIWKKKKKKIKNVTLLLFLDGFRHSIQLIIIW